MALTTDGEGDDVTTKTKSFVNEVEVVEHSLKLFIDLLGYCCCSFSPSCEFDFIVGGTLRFRIGGVGGNEEEDEVEDEHDAGDDVTLEETEVVLDEDEHEKGELTDLMLS